MNISICQTDTHSYRYIMQSVLKVFPRLQKATFILKIYIKRCGETKNIIYHEVHEKIVLNVEYDLVHPCGKERKIEFFLSY